jgi:hypothetical protein
MLWLSWLLARLLYHFCSQIWRYKLAIAIHGFNIRLVTDMIYKDLGIFICKQKGVVEVKVIGIEIKT